MSFLDIKLRMLNLQLEQLLGRWKFPNLQLLCNDGGRKCADDITYRSRYDIHDIGRVLDLTIEGFGPSRVAKWLKHEGISISKQAVTDIVCRSQKPLIWFEHEIINERFSSIRPRNSSVLYIDDMWIWISRVKHYPSIERKYDRRYVWATNVLEQDSRYWPGVFVSPPRIWKGIEKSEGKLRGVIATQDVINRVLALGIPPPVEVRCDGHRGHIRGAEKVLPDTPIIVRTKAQDIAFINFIERLNRDVRWFLRGLGKLRTVHTLGCCLELYRIHYNFIRSHMGLSGSTPARALGISLPNFNGFEDLLRYALERHGHRVP